MSPLEIAILVTFLSALLVAVCYSLFKLGWIVPSCCNGLLAKIDGMNSTVHTVGIGLMLTMLLVVFNIVAPSTKYDSAKYIVGTMIVIVVYVFQENVKKLIPVADKRQCTCWFVIIVVIACTVIATKTTCALWCEEKIALPTATPEPPPKYWAQLVNVTDNPTQPSKAVAFRVTPIIADIDGLKKAVKAEWDASNPKEPLNVFKLKVYAHDAATGKWVEVTEPWAPLAANTGETAYHVLVP